MQQHHTSGAGGDAIASANSRRKFLFAMAGSAATLPAVAIAGATAEFPQFPQLSNTEQVAMLRGQLARMRQESSFPCDALDTDANAQIGQFDPTILYLKLRFELAAEDLVRGTPKEQIAAFKQMVACAEALILIPAYHLATIEAKRNVAGWSYQEGSTTLRLSTETSSALLASADQDDGARK